MVGQSQPFDRVTIEKAFERLGEMALAAGKIVEISVYDGSALILTLNQRPATKDVDAVFEKDRAFVRRTAAVIADEFGWKADWINDGVKGFSAGPIPILVPRDCFERIRQMTTLGCASCSPRRHTSSP